jgi:hypothetical protein
MLRTTRGLVLLLAVSVLIACQSPSDPDETPDFLDVTVSPEPAVASGPGTGRFYVVQRDDRPDETREYDWTTSFTVTVRLNEHADDEDVNLEFPVRITAATVKVQQASGGIVTAPTGTESERFEYVSQASSNRFSGASTGVSMTYQVWYDLPNLRREALVTVTLTFVDENGRSFSEVVEALVAP